MRHRLTSCLLFMLQSQWSRLFDTFRHTQFNFIAPWPHFLSPFPLQPGHPFTRSWMNPPCLRASKVPLKSGNFGAGLRSYWTGLGWAVHHRLRLSFVPRTSPWPPSSLLSCAASAVSFWCAPVKRANSHWNVSASSVVLFRVLFYMFILICCMFHMLFMAFGGDIVIVANVSITVPCIATIMSRDVMERTNCKNSQDGAVYSIEINL